MSQASAAPPGRRPTGLRSERKRQAIVTAARSIFVKHGYDAGMDLIAEAAGVSKVTIYNHFGSKEQLFTEVISGAFEEALAGTADLTLPHLPGTAGFRQALTVTARAWIAGITRPEVTDLRLLIICTSRRFPVLAQRWLALSPRRLGPVIAETLRNLTSRGDLNVPDPDLAVIQFYALTVYPHIVRSMFGIPLDRRATEELITSGVDMFLSYYSAKDS